MLLGILNMLHADYIDGFQFGELNVEETPVQGRRQLDISIRESPENSWGKNKRQKKDDGNTKPGYYNRYTLEDEGEVLEIQMNKKTKIKTKNDIHERGNNNRFT